MGLKIEDGTGKGFSAKVNAHNQLETMSVITDMQHYLSLSHGSAYNVKGSYTGVNNGTHTILHIRNDSLKYDIVVEDIKLQIIDFSGGTALPSENTYFSIGFDGLVTASGTQVTPINLNRSSGNEAPVVVTNEGPVISASYTEVLKWYAPGNGIMSECGTSGTVILGHNDTMQVNVVTDATSGTAIANMRFVMIDREHLV